ncbi:cofilin-1-like [Stegostoma tigrinum]|uniref:cofilin-1-like n=1 Tax=Stegostoma tigrinum TaxID=3053191 RepID=UPI00202B7CEB|nr:cofilin-1-like [Stegostoma tigrinum]
MDCGIQVKDSVIDAFNQMKIVSRKTEQRRKFLCLRVSDDDRYVIVNEESDSVKKPSEDDFLQFLSYLKSDCCCIVIYDVCYETTNSLVKDDLVIVNWCPEKAPAKQKLQFASAINIVKTKLQGVKATLQFNSMEDVNRIAIAEKLGKDVVKVEGVKVEE